MSIKKYNACFLGCESEYEDADIVIFGAPFDSTTSFRPGTRFASKVMRSESFGVETYSLYQDKDLEDINVFDGGDLELIFGDPAIALDQIEEFASEVLSDNKMPFLIGGEHLVTLGTVRAVAKKYENLHIIHFDAHADLRADYLGQELSHACVMRRCWEIIGDNKIFQFGIRSGERQEFTWGKDHVYTNKFNLDHLDEVIDKLKDVPVYITIDLDILDPSIFPGTGTPEAGGIDFNTLLGGILKFTKLNNIVGMDINELSPSYDTSGVSTAVACKVLREMLLVK
ncbi:MAG: speB [Clostridiales bacterium]|jgi:agmatinase|nr:speB [Clostridiales bacterium]